MKNAPQKEEVVGLSRKSFLPLDHAGALRISTRTTTNIRLMYKPEAANVEPHEVIKVLNKAGIKFTLVGAHGIAGWLDEPRATQDVDVLIRSRHQKAVQAIKKAFPKLSVHDLPAVTRFIDPADGLPVIDLIKTQADIHKADRPAIDRERTTPCSTHNLRADM